MTRPEDRKTCVRCGRRIVVKLSRKPGLPVICHDCCVADPWYVEAVAS